MAYPKPVRFLAALLLPAATLLPTAVIAEQGPATLATMPAAPPPIGLPQLQSQLSCPALQQRLLATVGGQASLWSITIADSQGRLLADLNGSRPRIPASNQKLVSTAYALDRLRRAGVEQAEWIGADTYSDPELFFSNRRALHLREPDFGRMLSAIALV